jgi:hypothetical protein
MIIPLICFILGIPPSADYDATLDAIKQVESGGRCDLIGDNGKAIGPYQIHRCYWQDAVAYDKNLGGVYSDCTNEAYARKVCIAYLSRYAPCWDAEIVARIHNGGPKGHTRSSTLSYWKKVKAQL